MEELKNLINSVDKHARETGTYMHSADVVNFVDHINPMGDDCTECRHAVYDYTNGELIIRINIEPGSF